MLQREAQMHWCICLSTPNWLPWWESITWPGLPCCGPPGSPSSVHCSHTFPAQGWLVESSILSAEDYLGKENESERGSFTNLISMRACCVHKSAWFGWYMNRTCCQSPVIWSCCDVYSSHISPCDKVDHKDIQVFKRTDSQNFIHVFHSVSITKSWSCDLHIWVVDVGVVCAIVVQPIRIAYQGMYNMYCHTKSPKSYTTHVNSASEHPSSSLVRLTQILSYLPFVSHRKEEELTFAASWEPVSPGTVTVCKKSIEAWWPHASSFASACCHKS